MGRRKRKQERLSMDAPQRETAEPSPLVVPEEIQQSLLYPSPPEHIPPGRSTAHGEDLFDRLLVGMTAAQRRKNASRRRCRIAALVLLLIIVGAACYFGGETAMHWTEERMPQLAGWLNDAWQTVRNSR